MICTSNRPGPSRRRHGAGLLAASLFIVVGCRLAAGAARPPAIPAPTGPVVYTGADQVRSLASGPDGSLWAATAGGVLRWGGPEITGAPPRRWTTGDGLASNDIRALLPEAGGGAVVATATGVSRIDPGGAVTTRAAPAGAEVRSLLPARGAGNIEGVTTVATDRGLFLPASDGGWRPLRADPAADDANVWRTAASSHEGVSGWAVTGRSLLRLADDKRFPLPPASDDKNAPRAGTVTAFAAGDRGDVWLATTLGLWHFRQGRWQEIALPPDSPASHVGALLLERGQVVAGLYGDGLYRLVSADAAKRWERLANATPEPCRFITALAALKGGGMAVGTASDGVWDFEPRRAAWKRRPIPHGLPSADVYGLAAFDGALWAATFDRGLLRVDPGSGTVTPVTRTGGGLSADWTRGLVVFRNALFVRHATGQVDRLDEVTGAWRPAFAKGDLPRPQVFAMAADRGDRLLVGGWAGWAATNGETWEHHWKEAGLDGQVVTAIAAGGDGAVWIGTQKKGLFRYKDGAYTHFHEAHGLTDDWITCIAASPDGRLLVGTYTGGLLEWEPAGGGRFGRVLDPRGFAIRAIDFLPGTRRALAATPLGVYEEGDGGAWRLLDPKASGGLEAQAVLAVPQGLWIGTRAGLAFVPGSGDHLIGARPGG